MDHKLELEQHQNLGCKHVSNIVLELVCILCRIRIFSRILYLEHHSTQEHICSMFLCSIVEQIHICIFVHHSTEEQKRICSIFLYSTEELVHICIFVLHSTEELVCSTCVLCIQVLQRNAICRSTLYHSVCISTNIRLLVGRMELQGQLVERSKRLEQKNKM